MSPVTSSGITRHRRRSGRRRGRGGRACSRQPTPDHASDPASAATPGGCTRASDADAASTRSSAGSAETTCCPDSAPAAALIPEGCAISRATTAPAVRCQAAAGARHHAGSARRSDSASDGCSDCATSRRKYGRAAAPRRNPRHATGRSRTDDAATRTHRPPRRAHAGRTWRSSDARAECRRASRTGRRRAECRPGLGSRSATARQGAIRSADGCTRVPGRTYGHNATTATATATA